MVAGHPGSGDLGRVTPAGLTTEVVVAAVRWYPRFNLSYRDEVEVDHFTAYR
ncbi:hypothetical protein GCM10010399_08880 [Dactylosporangium fulvum]